MNENEEIARKKLIFFFSKKIDIKFSLINKPHYLIEGKIIKLLSEGDFPKEVCTNKELEMVKNYLIAQEKLFPKSIINKEDFKLPEFPKKLSSFNNFVVISNNKTPMFIKISEIDPETIFPISYNPITSFIRQSISDELRQLVFQRDNKACKYNLEGCTIDKDLEIDHIIPVSLGGLNVVDNLITSCQSCNRKKGSKLIYPRS